MTLAALSLRAIGGCGSEDSEPLVMPTQTETACMKHVDCAGGTCVLLEENMARCIPMGQNVECEYWSEDTKCVGVVEEFGSPDGGPVPAASSDPPDAVVDGTNDNYDPSFEHDGQLDSNPMNGCQGTALRITVPVSTEPGCTSKHPIRRCRRVGDRCVLLSGTTAEHYAP